MNVRMVDRSEIERIAHILGGGSAAADALRAADAHEGDVRYYHVRTKRGDRWIVERLEPNTGSEPK